jgi:glycosyltransferase involved in cell wall biosynthesis
VRRALDHIVRHALFVLTNTEELADFIRPLNAGIVQLPTFFDFDVIAGVTAEQSTETRIGFAGSTSRVSDLEIVKPVIQPILEAYPDVVFEFAGVLPADLAPNDRIRFFDYQSDYASYIRFQVLRGWCIGLAPLIDNESNRCKTDNKYREYAACSIVGVYSDVRPYQRAVKNGVTGIIVENTSAAWLSALAGLLDDRAAMRQLGRNAEADARGRYCVGKIAAIWSDFFVRAERELQRRGTRPIAIVVTEPSLATKLSMLRLLATISYREGGMALVARRALRRIGRYLGLDVPAP